PRGARRPDPEADAASVAEQLAQRPPCPLAHEPDDAPRHRLAQGAGAARGLEQVVAGAHLRGERQRDAGGRQGDEDLVGLLAPEPGSALTREVADVAEDDQVAEHGAADPHAVLGPAGPDPADAALEQGGEAVPLGARRRQRVLAAAGLGELDRVQVPAGRQGGLRVGAVGVGREGLEVGPAAVEPRLGAYQQHGRQHAGRASEGGGGRAGGSGRPGPRRGWPPTSSAAASTSAAPSTRRSIRTVGSYPTLSRGGYGRAWARRRGRYPACRGRVARAATRRSGGAMREVHVLGVPMDLGAGRRGVDMGPSALRLARLERTLESLGAVVTDLGNVEVAVAETYGRAGAGDPL